MAVGSVGGDARPTIDDPHELRGWYFYDWACTAFSTSVVSVFLGPYLTALAKNAADAQGRVELLSVPIAAGAFFPLILSLSVLLQVLCLPLLGAIADYTDRKKHLLAFCAYLGAFATMSMAVLQGTNYRLGGALLLVANLAFGASIVMSNSFLPIIASPDRRDAVSARSWAMGFIGGGLLLALNLGFFTQRQAFGLTDGQAVRVCLLAAGLWWGSFALIPLRALKQRAAAKPLPAGARYLSVGVAQLRATLRATRRYPQTLRFLGAYMLYADGIAAVIALSSQFGSEELGLSQDTLIQVILLVQVVGFVGALAFGTLARGIGAKRAVMIALAIWTGVIFYAYALIEKHHPLQFFVLGAVIALVLGSTLALSRSLFSLMIPSGQEAEFFGLYEICSSGTSWLAPLLFALALQFSGSYRIAIGALVIFFIAGLILLARVDVRKAMQDVASGAKDLKEQRN